MTLDSCLQPRLSRTHPACGNFAHLPSSLPLSPQALRILSPNEAQRPQLMNRIPRPPNVLILSQEPTRIEASKWIHRWKSGTLMENLCFRLCLYLCIRSHARAIEEDIGHQNGRILGIALSILFWWMAGGRWYGKCVTWARWMAYHLPRRINAMCIGTF